MELTTENENRYVIFPIEHKGIWEFYEKQRAAFWWDDEIAFLPEDEEDWKSLSDNERYFMENILAFFASADGIVMENLAVTLLQQVQLPEARAFFTIQLMMELHHSIVYAKLLDGYVRDEVRKEQLLKGYQTIPIVKAKTDWAKKWISEATSLAETFVAFACVEGVFFQGEFCSIFWFKEKKKLQALTISNYFISRDEGIHLDFSCYLYREYLKPHEKLSDDHAHKIIRSALEIEREFINGALNCKLIGMNAELMNQYIDHVANSVCIKLGHTPLFTSTSNPFDFMDRLCFDVKTNFFEGRVSEYRKTKSSERLGVEDLDFSDTF